jgi:hypothetical protein
MVEDRHYDPQYCLPYSKPESSETIVPPIVYRDNITQYNVDTMCEIKFVPGQAMERELSADSLEKIGVSRRSDPRKPQPN